MSIYDSMIVNNIVDFCSWMKSTKNVSRLDITSRTNIRELAKEYVLDTYGGDDDEP